MDHTMISNLGSKRRAHIFSAREHTAATKIKTVGIPEGADGWIVMVMPIGVPFTGIVEQIEILVAQVE